MVWSLLFYVLPTRALEPSPVAAKVHCDFIVSNNPVLPIPLEADDYILVYGLVFTAVERPGGGEVEISVHSGKEIHESYNEMSSKALRRAGAPRPNTIPLVSAYRESIRKQQTLERIGRIFQKAEVRIYVQHGEILPTSWIKLLVMDSLHWDDVAPNEMISQEVQEGTSGLFHVPFLRLDGTDGLIPAQIECGIEP